MFKNKLVVASAALVVILVGVFVALNISPKEADPDLDENLVAETEDLLPQGEAGSPGKLKGACNMIAQASTCVEYFGSYWTDETIQMTCQDGTFSEDGCPEPNMGGCRMYPESETDMITWHYDTGGDPFTLENAQYAAQACNAVPGGVWSEED